MVDQDRPLAEQIVRLPELVRIAKGIEPGEARLVCAVARSQCLLFGLEQSCGRNATSQFDSTWTLGPL